MLWLVYVAGTLCALDVCIGGGQMAADHGPRLLADARRHYITDGVAVDEQQLDCV